MTWPARSTFLANEQAEMRQLPGLIAQVPWLLDRQGRGNGLASTLNFPGCWTGRDAAVVWTLRASSLAVRQAEMRQWPGLHAHVPWLLDRQWCGKGLASTLKFLGCWTGRGAAMARPPHSSSLAVGQAELRQLPGLHTQVPRLLDRYKCGNGLAHKLKFPGCWTGKGGAMAWPPRSNSLANEQTEMRQWPGLLAQIPWLLDRQWCGKALASTLKFLGCWTGRGAALARPPRSSSQVVGQAVVQQWPGFHVQLPWLLDRQGCGNGLASSLNFPGCWIGRGAAIAWPPRSTSLGNEQTEMRQ
jgi:hypothetical protein